MKEEKKKPLSVDIKHLECAFDVDLHEFGPGECSLSLLWNRLMARLKPRGDAK